MKHIYKIIFTIFLFLCMSVIQARDIYVAKNGNDTNGGTIDLPYLTITKVVNVAVA